MDLSIPPAMLFIASWLGTLGGVWALFERGEQVISPEAKSATSRWLQNLRLPEERIHSWVIPFQEIVDRVFGYRLFSIRSALVSLAFSLASVGIGTLLYAYIRPLLFSEMIESFGTGYIAIVLVIGAVIMNGIPDYVSLIQTRYLLRWVAAVRTSTARLALILLDLGLTSALVLGVLYFVLTVFLTGDEFFSVGETFVRSLKFEVGSRAEDDISLGVFVYSTYFTSVWLWIFLVSGMLVRMISSTNFALRILRQVLDLEQKPLRSLGFVSMLLVTLAYCAILVVQVAG
jgi:hypothetical protein